MDDRYPDGFLVWPVRHNFAEKSEADPCKFNNLTAVFVTVHTRTRPTEDRPNDGH